MTASTRLSSRPGRTAESVVYSHPLGWSVPQDGLVGGVVERLAHHAHIHVHLPHPQHEFVLRGDPDGLQLSTLDRTRRR